MINALDHFERSAKLFEKDREMASFRAITGEEEAATAFMKAIQLRKYPHAEEFKLTREILCSMLPTLLRHETFGHGRVGDRPTHDHLLTAEELDVVSAIMVNRYREMSFEQFAELPQPLSALFAWQQAGDPDGPRVLLEAKSQTDEGLVAVLEKLSGLVRSSGGEFVTLSRSNLTGLLDYEAARQRIVNLTTSRAEGDPLRARAEAVLLSFRQGVDSKPP
jgi:hypothetical protein